MAVPDERLIQGKGFACGRWLVVAALGVAAGLLAGQLASSDASAQVSDSGVSSGGSGNIFAVAGQITHDNYGLYLVDLKHSTICVYQFLPGNDRRLKLMAARTYLYDTQLDEYNTEPSPQQIKNDLSRARPLKEVPATRPN